MGEENSKNWEVILLRLDTIAANQEEFGDRLTNIERQLNSISTLDYEIKSLKDWRLQIEPVASPNELKNIVTWKKNIDEIVSPSQLKEKLIDVEKLKTFKTQALMIWVVIQILMAIAMFAQRWIP